VLTAAAIADGGPAAGTRFTVEVVAGYLPVDLGLAGANYVLDRSALYERPATYLHWPLNAPEPIKRVYDVEEQPCEP
jgi:hypothetical protein